MNAISDPVGSSSSRTSGGTFPEAAESTAAEWTMIQKEMLSAERALLETEQERQSRRHPETTAATPLEHDCDASNNNRSNLSSWSNRLIRLEYQTNDLMLAHDVAVYCTKHQQKQQSSEGPLGTNIPNDNQNHKDWNRLQDLGSLLLLHRPQQQQRDPQFQQEDPVFHTHKHPTVGPLYEKLVREEFWPLSHSLLHYTQRSLRQTLVRMQYPNVGVEDHSSFLGAVEPVQAIAGMLRGIAALQEQVAAAAGDDLSSVYINDDDDDSSPSAPHRRKLDPVLEELCRPIVERVCFHFLSQSSVRQTQNTSNTIPGSTTTTIQNNNAMSHRIDRLPEWLLGYMREQVFQPNGPWEWIVDHGLLPVSDRGNDGVTHATTSRTAVTESDFVNEMICLIQFVLAERNFFRDPLVSGPASQAAVLCRAVEQLLQFDAFLQRDILIHDDDNDNRCRFVSLMDACVSGDEELFAWWLDRERESVASTLFDKDAIVVVDKSVRFATTSGGVAGLAVEVPRSRVSPRAELFCALIRSIRIKAAVFSFSGPYLVHVAVPLCVRFLDALHETAADLTQQLTGRHHGRNRNALLTNSELETIYVSWIELINGAHMAATTLLASEASLTSTDQTITTATPADDDLARLGRSLERLQGVMLDDFVASVVEVLIMERAKLAGYLMRCSHLLSSDDVDEDLTKLSDISPDLEESQRIVCLIVSLCNDVISFDDVRNAQLLDNNNFATRLMRELLLSSIAEKLLEVALDLQGMTPELRHQGCLLFSRDVRALFGDCRYLPNHALRILDVAKFMSMKSSILNAIGGTLCGLAGRPAPLNEAFFEVDDKLFEEAISMIRAKGFVYLELSDVFAILNRRQDLFQS